MSAEWLDLMQDSGLWTGDNQDAAFRQSKAVPADEAQLLDLSDLSVVDVTGSDAAEFLQGQFCNDFLQVTTTQSQITGYCTPKGRLLALPIAVSNGSGFRLIIPQSVGEAFCKRLGMFVMRSDVAISIRDDIRCLGLISNAADSLGQAAEYLEELPSGSMSSLSNQDTQLIRWHDDVSGEMPRSRFMRIAEESDQVKLWQACPQLTKSTSANWQLADIAAGVPMIHQGVIEAFVPQMVNLHLINALSFTKGCYPGQEIVARMQYLGKLKRQMRLYEFKASAALPMPGDSLSTDTDADAGVVVNAVSDAQGNGLLLAVVKVSASDQDMATGEHPLTDRPLPYELPSATTENGCTDN